MDIFRTPDGRFRTLSGFPFDAGNFLQETHGPGVDALLLARTAQEGATSGI